MLASINYFKDAKILVAEDLEYNRALIKDILTNEGYNNVFFANDGLEAIEVANSEKPDLILLDLIMPRLDGRQACVQIKSNPETKNIPIIIQSAVNSVREREMAFLAGANDFINKPIEAIEMIARIRIQLEQHKMFMQLLEFKERMKQELDEAKMMLLSIIPKDTKHVNIAKKYGISIASHYQPSSELGGDYYGIKEVKDNVVALYIWDFSGHGITAAINTFRLHSILQNMHEYRHDPALLLLMLNERLYKLLSVEQYATMFYAVLDIKAQRLKYVGAGSASPFLISFKDRKVKKVNASGFPLGIIDSPDYQNTIIDFKDWDTIFLYSDALIETEDKDKNVFDAHQFITNLIENSKGFPTENRSAWLLDKVLQEFNSRYVQNISDDLTITVISKQSLL